MAWVSQVRKKNLGQKKIEFQGLSQVSWVVQVKIKNFDIDMVDTSFHI